MASGRGPPKAIGIHQPNWLPWAGYFAKIRRSDVFVFHDDVEFTKRGPTRRTRIPRAKGESETAWLTVPLRRHSDHARIRELLVDHDQDWPREHRHRMENAWRGAPFFDEVFPVVDSWLARASEFERLADLNEFAIGEIMAILGLDTPRVRSSDLPVGGKGGEYNLALVRHLGGGIYLSGRGGAKYQDPDAFARAGVGLRYVDAYPWLEENPYPRAGGPSVNGLTILDALVHLGPAGTRDLLDRIPVVPA